MKVVYLFLLAAFAGLMFHSTRYLPARGDPDAPLHRRTSAAGDPLAAHYFIQQAYEDAKTPNMVTVVLADYRGFDTLGETLVVFSAAIACYLILRRKEERE